MGDAQSIPQNLAALTGTGSRQIGWAKANAMAAKGDVGGDNSAGGVIGINGNPHPDTAGRAMVAQPVEEDGWGDQLGKPMPFSAPNQAGWGWLDFGTAGGWSLGGRPHLWSQALGWRKV